MMREASDATLPAGNGRPKTVPMARPIRKGNKRQDKGAVLYMGQAYYHPWYLSRELRKLGWRADVVNWSAIPSEQKFFHGEDIRFGYGSWAEAARQLVFYLRSLRMYDIFHFANAHGMRFGHHVHDVFARAFHEYAEVELIKKLGKKIVYTNNGCYDGVAQSSFGSWGDRPVCADCQFRTRPEVCSDERNLSWGRVRNSLADYQCLTGGNRVDYNVDPRIHEVPEVYCMDRNVWRPDLPVPTNYRLPLRPESVKIYHAVGGFEGRTDLNDRRNLKSSHIYLPLIEKMKADGLDVELMFFHNVPNIELRYYQVQADIVVDMLTFGWFGANVREALMLGKPVVNYIRPEFADQVREELPEYIDELPIVSATPETVESVLKDLVQDPDRRREIGRRSREFALKWHSAEAGAKRMDQIYSSLLEGQAA
jgi:hypothetical protein